MLYDKEFLQKLDKSKNKTIYARMGDLAVAGEDEFGTALGDVSGKLKQMGVIKTIGANIKTYNKLVYNKRLA